MENGKHYKITYKDNNYSKVVHGEIISQDETFVTSFSKLDGKILINKNIIITAIPYEIEESSKIYTGRKDPRHIKIYENSIVGLFFPEKIKKSEKYPDKCFICFTDKYALFDIKSKDFYAYLTDIRTENLVYLGSRADWGVEEDV